MGWLALLGLAVLFTAAAAVTGAKPSGTRPVARTRMMTAARIVLALLALVFLLLALDAGLG